LKSVAVFFHGRVSLVFPLCFSSGTGNFKRCIE
jgi:hypothetical protein